MNRCTNPTIGKIITRYEFDLESEDEKKLFESHLLECDVCFEDLYSMSKITKTMKEKPEIFIGALNESMAKRKVNSLKQFKRSIANLIYNYSSSISSLLLQHRVITISVATCSVIFLFAIILWRSSFFEKLSSKQTPELTQNKEILADSSKVVQHSVPSNNSPSSTTPVTKPVDFQKESDIRSLAVIEHEHYTALLSNDKSTEAKEASFYDGINYYEQKNYPRAIISLSQIDETSSKYTEAQFYLGMSYLLLNDTGRGIKYLQTATKTNNNIIKEKSHWYLGNIYLLLNDTEHALLEFEIVVQLKSEFKDKAEKIIRKINY